MARSLRIGWISYHAEGLPALREVVAQGWHVCGVLSLPAERRERLSASVDYGAVCRELGLKYLEIDDVNDGETIRTLRSMELDLLVVLGWGQILKEEALSCARLGVVGAHASLLPSYRGGSPVNWAIIRGETLTGNTLMWLSSELDRGEIVDQYPIDITPYDTCGTIYEGVAQSNKRMVLGLLENLEMGIRPGRPQPDDNEPLLPRRRPQDGLIDWADTARNVYNLIRGVARPYPGARTLVGGSEWHIWDAALLPDLSPGEEMQAEPGLVLGPVVSPSDVACGQLVACGEGCVLVLEMGAPSGEILRGRILADQPWRGMIWGR